MVNVHIIELHTKNDLLMTFVNHALYDSVKKIA